MSTFPEPRDRQDLSIWTAIEGKNWKQALKLVEKKLAKKKDDFTKATRFYILCNSHASDKAAATLQLLTLSKEAVSADVEVLGLYDMGAKALFPTRQKQWADTVGAMRLKAVQQNPKLESLALDCFRACFQEDDLEHANVIINLLNKQYPSKRRYIYWRLTVMVLLSSSPRVADKMREIYSKLAYQEIKKLATTTQAELKDSTNLSARSIQTPQELQLLHRIVAATGDESELLAYLVDEHLGSASTVAKGEWNFVRERVLQLQKLAKWDELFTFCTSLLKGARANSECGIVDSRGGDFTVWLGLLEAVERLPSQFYAVAEEELKAHLEPEAKLDKTFRRNAHLARLELVCAGVRCGKETSGSTRVAALLQYFEEYGNIPAFFSDVTSCISELSQDEQSNAVRHLKEMCPPRQPLEQGNITSRINISKIEYLIISQRQSLRQQNPEAKYSESKIHQNMAAAEASQFQRLAAECLHQYCVAIRDGEEITKSLLSTDQHPADDWCIIAAMCLIKVASADACNAAWYLQAGVILETAWSKSRTNAGFSLLLTRIYSLLGAGSLALRAYQRLGIKQMQADTLSYILFDRISSLHPHKVSESNHDQTLLDPSSYLENSFRLYRRAKWTIQNNSWKSFQYDNYSTVFELKEVTDHLRRSIAANLSSLELRRMIRLTTGEIDTSSHGYDLLTLEPLSDELDYSVFPNYEGKNSPGIEKLLRLGPALSTTRVRVLRLLEQIFLMSSSLTSSAEGKKSQLEELVKIRKLVLQDRAVVDADIFTVPEALLAQISLALSDLIDTACSSATNDSFADIKTGLSELLLKTSKLVDVPTDGVPTFTQVLHPIYVAYEICMASSATINWLSQPKVSTQAAAGVLKDLSAEVASVRSKVIAHGGKLKKRMDEGGWLDYIESSVLGPNAELEAALEDFVGGFTLEEWAGEVAQSWRDSAAGMSLLKLE